MGKFEEKMETYMNMVKKYNLDISEKLLTNVAKSLGPSIYNSDAEGVACSDKVEVQRVIDNYLKKSLGLSHSDDELANAVKEVCEKMDTKNPKKYRPIFYALLAKKFGKDGIYDA